MLQANSPQSTIATLFWWRATLNDIPQEMYGLSTYLVECDVIFDIFRRRVWIWIVPVPNVTSRIGDNQDARQQYHATSENVFPSITTL